MIFTLYLINSKPSNLVDGSNIIETKRDSGAKSLKTVSMYKFDYNNQQACGHFYLYDTLIPML